MRLRVYVMLVTISYGERRKKRRCMHELDDLGNPIHVHGNNGAPRPFPFHQVHLYNIYPSKEQKRQKETYRKNGWFVWDGIYKEKENTIVWSGHREEDDAS